MRSDSACEWVSSKPITKVLMNPPYENKYGCMTIVENVLDSVQRKAIVMEMLFQHPHTYTHVYHQTVIFCEQKITVSTTSTT